MTDWTTVPSGTGAGGGFGTTAPNRACGVEGCGDEGRPQICPYDKRYHRHGMVHYQCGYPESRLAFRKGWHLLCNEHFAIVKAERKAFED
jgi:hypothetical protein